MKSLMIVPYVSNRTFPEYIRQIILDYSYKPEKTLFVPNDRNRPHYMNQPDMKMIEMYEKYQPEDIIIIHNSDVYLNPNDLYVMESKIVNRVFACGIYPITNLKHTSLHEPPVIPTRVAVWNAKIFGEVLPIVKERMKENGGILDDAQYWMGEEAIKRGYECVVDTDARVYHVRLQEDFGTFVNR